MAATRKRARAPSAPLPLNIAPPRMAVNISRTIVVVNRAVERLQIDERVANIALLNIVINRAIDDRVQKKTFLEALGDQFDFYKKKRRMQKHGELRESVEAAAAAATATRSADSSSACVRDILAAVAGYDAGTIAAALACCAVSHVIVHEIPREEFVGHMGDHYDSHAVVEAASGRMPLEAPKRTIH